MPWQSPRFAARKQDRSPANPSPALEDSFFALALDPMWAATFEGQLRSVNPALVEALGLPETQLLDCNLLDIVHPDDRAAATAAFACLKGGRPANGIRSRMHCADGSWKPLVWRAKPMRALGLVYSVARDNTREELHEEALRQAEARYVRALESTTDAFFAVNRDWRLTRINQQAMRIWKRDGQALLGAHFWEAFPEAAGGPLHSVYDQVMRTGIPAHVQEFYPYAPHNGWFEVHVYPTPEGLAVYFRDVTERRRNDDKVRQTLQEKEVLLREVHHRVKNNLQVICSMLRLQERNFNDPSLLQALRDCRERVMAMAMLHDQLHRAKDFSNINLGEYIRNLAASLFCSYGVNSAEIELRMDIEEIPVLVDTAIPCGLIVNELISNSLRHAFPEGAKGCVSLGLHARPGALVELTIADNGRGFPETAHAGRHRSLGLWLVELLASQIGASVERSSSGGAHYRLVFQES